MCRLKSKHLPFLLAAFLQLAVLACPAQAVNWISESGGLYQDGSNWEGGSPPLPTETAVFDSNLPFLIPVEFKASAQNAATIVHSGWFELRTFNSTLTTDLLRVDSTSQSVDTLLTFDLGSVINAAKVEVVGNPQIEDLSTRLAVRDGRLNSQDAVVYGGSESVPADVSLSVPWDISRNLFIGGDQMGPRLYGDVTVGTGRLRVGRRLHLWETGRLLSSLNSITVVGTGSPTLQEGFLYVTADGTVSGDGVIFRAAVRNEGLVQVGEIGGTGQLQIDGTGQFDLSSDYFQLPTGNLEMEVGGLEPISEYDQLHLVTGSAYLEGVLDLSFINDFVPTVDDEIELINLRLGSQGTINGAFDAVPTNLGTVDADVAIELQYNDTNVRAKFVAPSLSIGFQESQTVSNWWDPENWTTGIVPNSTNIISMVNQTSTALRVEVVDNGTPDSANAFVHRLRISGVTEPLTVAVQAGSFLSSTTEILVAKNGRIELGGGTVASGAVDVQKGAELIGDGTIVGDVFNDGTLAPGSSPGKIVIEGNLVANPSSVMEIEIGGRIAGDEFDTIEVTGDITLGGSLLISIIDLADNGASGVFEPIVGDKFDILRTDTGTIVGQIASILSFGLPPTIGWDIQIGGAGGGASVTLTAIEVTPGDMDSDGDVDGNDFLAWQANFGMTTGAAREQGDTDGDGDVDGNDFLTWQANFGAGRGSGATAVPEPRALLLLAVGISISFVSVRRRA